jgi:hypothetical protein
LPPLQITAWTSSITVVLAPIVALFKEDFQALWRRPELVASAKLCAPDCHKTEVTLTDQQTGQIIDRWPCYYFRIWVENKGNQRANQVQLFMARLLGKHADGIFRPEDQFLPMNLRWSHSGEVFANGISPEMGKHCDLGHINHPGSAAKVDETLPGVTSGKVVMGLDLEVRPNTKSHLLAPGTYQLVLKLAASNSKPVVKTLEFTLIGDWYDDERQMFSNGVGLREIS